MSDYFEERDRQRAEQQTQWREAARLEEQQREAHELECYRQQCEEEAIREEEYQAYCECCYIASAWINGEISEEDAETAIYYTHYGWSLDEAADHITYPSIEDLNKTIDPEEIPF